MNNNGKKYWVNHDAEENARHVMGAVLVIVLAAGLACGLLIPALYWFVR